jgi:hypothetical protein
VAGCPLSLWERAKVRADLQFLLIMKNISNP